jgi:hypothetical protein
MGIRGRPGFRTGIAQEEGDSTLASEGGRSHPSALPPTQAGTLTARAKVGHMGAELEFIQGQTIGRKVPLDGVELTVGRDSAAGLVVADSAISRRHAQFSFQGGLWYVADLGSYNGTYVNGMRLTGSPVLLNMGDTVQMGPVVLRIQDPAAAAEPTQMWSGTPMGPAQQYPVVQQPQVQQPQQHYMPTPFGENAPLAQQYPQPMQGPYGPQQPQQPMIMITGQKNLTWLWVILALVVLGPCGFIGLYNFKRFNGHPGWEGQTLKGLVMAIGGFAAVLLGAAWLYVAWFSPGAKTWGNGQNEPPPQTQSTGGKTGEGSQSGEGKAGAEGQPPASGATDPSAR